MNERTISPSRLALIALVGALILEAVVTFAVGLQDAFTAEQIPAHLAALLVGALGGWLFELFRELTITTNEAIRNVSALETSVTALTAKITYQDAALGMLTSCPRHNEALTALIRASMSDHFRNIPLVGAPSYLEFLKKAIEHSDGYEGVQRKPLRWYKETGAGSYLVDLKNRNMGYKTRLFIIEDADVQDMQDDLSDPEILEYYWTHTGQVRSYWMTTKEFRENFPGRRVPRDIALYDRQLLISYDERNQLLAFDVMTPERDECRLFDALEDMASHSISVLKPIQV